MSKRLIIDVSTLVRSEGSATGIVRVSHELARWVQTHRRDGVFVTYGRSPDRIFYLKPKWIEKVLSGTSRIDTSWLPDRLRPKFRIRDQLPLPFVRLLMWFQHPRRTLLLALERRRLKAVSDAAAERIGRVQQRLMSERDRTRYFDRSGNRRAVVPFDMALDGLCELRRGDILVLTGSDWGETNPKSYEQFKHERGIQLVWLCYDTIPLLYPQFYAKRVVDAFRQYVRDMMPICDLVILSARAVETDTRSYCARHEWPVPKMRVVPFGSDLTRAKAAAEQPLPAGLVAGRYVLFVSTIEPRKGHRMLFSVWKRLLEEGVPQPHDFKLVFVGRAGWLVEDLMGEMARHPSAGNSLLILKGISDEDLVALYRNAAFCVYPSVYEGYGLPIVEAFSYGKAVLASTGGALPEVARDFSPCIDPYDEETWYEMLREWIEEPAKRAPFEKAIRERYRHPTWDEAARTFFATIDEELS